MSSRSALLTTTVVKPGSERGARQGGGAALCAGTPWLPCDDLPSGGPRVRRENDAISVAHSSFRCDKPATRSTWADENNAGDRYVIVGGGMWRGVGNLGCPARSG